MTESSNIIESVQAGHGNKLILTGLAALQYPAVQTRQLTFYNPAGGKRDYFIGSYHVLIRRASQKSYTTKDHILYIAKHIELYADELGQLIAIIGDISLADFERDDRAWRLFAYLKQYCLSEKITFKKSIGGRYIDLGDISSPAVVKDSILHIRDGLLVPRYNKKRWQPQISSPADRKSFEGILAKSRGYFKEREFRPLFHRFSRYASRLESAASAKLEGYDARVEPQMLSEKIQKRLKNNLSLQANLNMDNIHRDIVELSKKSLTMDLLLGVQKAIVNETWRNEEERLDKTPGFIRPFDEVIVDRGRAGADNVVYIAPRHEDVAELLSELMDYYHLGLNSVHPLDLASIIHCQLVIIHPFGDGNGRLARWCFLHTLIKTGYIENIHAAPISHVFLEGKNRYYNELSKVDRVAMKYARYTIDEKTKRYRAHYENPDFYRKFDYSTWIEYVYEAFAIALEFSMEEHDVFERTESIFREFERLYPNLTPGQHHEVARAIDIGLKKEWGKKTESRLAGNGISTVAISDLKKIVAGKKGTVGCAKTRLSY